MFQYVDKSQSIIETYADGIRATSIFFRRLE